MVQDTLWRCEDEWRLIRDAERDSPPHGDTDMHLYPVDPDAVRSITIGIAFDTALKVDMANRIQVALPDAGILQAVEAEGSFAISNAQPDRYRNGWISCCAAGVGGC